MGPNWSWHWSWSWSWSHCVLYNSQLLVPFRIGLITLIAVWNHFKGNVIPSFVDYRLRLFSTFKVGVFTGDGFEPPIFRL